MASVYPCPVKTFIEPYPKEISIYARSSGYKQDYHPQLCYLTRRADQVNIRIAYVAGETRSGRSLEEENRPAFYSLLKRGVSILATDLTRYLRDPDFHPNKNPLAAPDTDLLSILAEEYEVTFYTILDPLSTPEESRNFLQGIAEEYPTPPAGPLPRGTPGALKRKKLLYVQLAIALWEDGYPVRYIAREVSSLSGAPTPESTIRSWVRGALSE